MSRSVLKRVTLKMALVAGIFALLLCPAGADDWPQWLGPQRDGVWRETGILKHFPKGGPVLRWSVAVKGGYAGPAIADGRVFVPDFVPSSDGRENASGKESENENYRQGSRTGEERLLCLDEKDGRILWTHKYPVIYTHAKLYANGPRTTPTVDGDRVYTLGAEGRLSCIDVKTGKERWNRDLKKDYSIKAPVWGFAVHPVIDGNRLITMVGGKGTAVVAFDKLTGKELWRSLTCRNTGYAQLVIYTIGSHRQLLAWHGEALNSLNPATGKVYWSTPVKPMYQMAIGMPRLEGKHLFIMSWGCSQAFELAEEPPTSKPLWQANKQIGVDGKVCVPWLEDGHIYAGGQKGVFRCVELATGNRVWETKEIYGNERGWIGSVFVVKNGSRFFICSELGDLIIAKLSPQGYEEIDRARVIKQTNVTGGKPVWWSHPAFANRSIYLRNDHTIHCYSLAEQPPTDDSPRTAPEEQH
jgi:outer membrane protein assembly factor BamB